MFIEYTIKKMPPEWVDTYISIDNPGQPSFTIPLVGAFVIPGRPLPWPIYQQNDMGILDLFKEFFFHFSEIEVEERVFAHDVLRGIYPLHRFELGTILATPSNVPSIKIPYTVAWAIGTLYA